MSQSPTRSAAEPGDVATTSPGSGGSPPPGGGSLLTRRSSSTGEGFFRFFSTGSGVLVLVIIVAIAVFLIYKAIPAIQADHANFLTYKQWDTSGTPPKFGIAALAFGTLLTGVIALILAVPVAMGIALFLS